jgi:hypothetical protein
MRRLFRKPPVPGSAWAKRPPKYRPLVFQAACHENGRNHREAGQVRGEGKENGESGQKNEVGGEGAVAGSRRKFGGSRSRCGSSATVGLQAASIENSIRCRPRIIQAATAQVNVKAMAKKSTSWRAVDIVSPRYDRRQCAPSSNP